MARLSGEEVIELVKLFSKEIELLNLGDEMKKSVKGAFAVAVRDFVTGSRNQVAVISESSDSKLI